MAIKDIAVSSGSACTSASLERRTCCALAGRVPTNSRTARSVSRIGRFTTEEEIDFTIKLLHDKLGKLRELSRCGICTRKASISVQRSMGGTLQLFASDYRLTKRKNRRRRNNMSYSEKVH
jgi:hypothetical protein